MKKIAIKLLVMLDDLSSCLSGYTITFCGTALTFSVFYSIIKELFKQNKYALVIAGILSLLSGPSWFDISEKIVNNRKSHILKDCAFLLTFKGNIDKLEK